MIIDDFHICGVATMESETQAPLVIDTNTVLASSTAFQKLKPITRRNSQIVNPARPVQLFEFASSYAFDICETSDACTIEQCFSVGTGEG